MPIDTSIYRQPGPPLIDLWGAIGQAQQFTANQQALREHTEDRALQQQQRQAQQNAAAAQGAEDEQLRALFANGLPSPGQVYRVVRDPKRATDIVTGIAALQQKQFQSEDAFFGNLAKEARGIQALPESLRPDAYTLAREKYKALGVDVSSIPETYAPEVVQGFIDRVTPKAEPKSDYTMGTTRYSGETNQPIATAPAATPKPSLITGVDAQGNPIRVEDKPGARVYQRPDTGGSGQNADMADVKLHVDGVMNGSLPPEIPSRSSRTYEALMAEFQRRGYNLTQAVNDWRATQRYLTSLNSTQQTRLRQAVSFTKDSLDVIEDLSGQWQGGRFPILNKANLAAARNGVYGDEVASVATRLESQIADLVSELGTVYKGGNSSTDESLRLAGENLKTNWSEKVLRDNIAQVRKNLQIRENSLRSGMPAGTSDNNPYYTGDPRNVPPTLATPPVTTGGQPAAPNNYAEYLRLRGKGR